MLIVYDSLTGNVQRFAQKTGLESLRIAPDLIVSEDFILVTYTTGFGDIPQTTISFLKKNNRFLKGVAVSGNRNWGKTYGQAGILISKIYQVPLLATFELSGTQQDVLAFKEEVSKIVNSIIH
jgi:protein involved in ribonucleotide reduction